jgi:ethanolamine utilization microcompartment shell protein EutS
MTDAITKALAAAVAGGFVGWGAHSLTLVGRVDAIEKALPRIEQRLDQLIDLQAKVARP